MADAIVKLVNNTIEVKVEGADLIAPLIAQARAAADDAGAFRDEAGVLAGGAAVLEGAAAASAADALIASAQALLNANKMGFQRIVPASDLGNGYGSPAVASNGQVTFSSGAIQGFFYYITGAAVVQRDAGLPLTARVPIV